MKTVDDFNFKDKQALIRVDFNVPLNDDLKVSIQLQPHENPKDLIQNLLTKARINHFVEVIPSVNDIFIKTVTHNA